jgi:4-aminobutyrate aminotransferase
MASGLETGGLEEAANRFLSPATRLSFPPVIVEGGQGAIFWDLSGRRFLDLHAMAGVLNIGYAHPRHIKAVVEQVRKLVHCNPAYVMHEAPIRLAERLAALTPGAFAKRVAFGLSGSDANDGAIKLARAATGRQRIIAFSGAYHGNTYGALSLSSVSAAMRRGFGPEVPGVVHVPYPDIYRDACRGTVDEVVARCLSELDAVFEAVAPPEDVAAIVLEPVQGDSGVIVPPQAYIDGLVERARRYGILLVAEEVQTGIGRTGRMCASEHFGLEPDMVILGKALGGGIPISAIVARSELMDAWRAPGHVFSTAVSPVAAIAALTVLDIVADEDLAGAAEARGAVLLRGLLEMAERYPVIGDVRGLGLMLGADLVLDRDSRARNRALTAKVVKGCADRGCFLTFLAGSVLRFIPPLVITDEQIEHALGVVEDSLAGALRGDVPDEEVRAFTGW